MLTLAGPAGPVFALTFSSDGEMLASAGAAEQVHLWRPPMDAVALNAREGGIQALAFSPDGRYLASGGIDRKVHVWDVRDHSLLTVTSVQTHAISAISFVGPGTVLFGIGERPGPVAKPSTLFLLDLPKGKARPTSFGVNYGIRALAALPDRRLAAWATDNKLLRVQDINRPATKAVVLRNDCRAIALSNDGRRLAVTSDWEVVIFNVYFHHDRWTEDRGATLGRHQGVVSTLAFGPDGQTLYAGDWKNTVRVWDVDRGTERASFTWPIGNRVNAVAVSPDGLRAAAAGDSGTIVVWDLD